MAEIQRYFLQFLFLILICPLKITSIIHISSWIILCHKNSWKWDDWLGLQFERKYSFKSDHSYSSSFLFYKLIIAQFVLKVAKNSGAVPWFLHHFLARLTVFPFFLSKLSLSKLSFIWVNDLYLSYRLSTSKRFFPPLQWWYLWPSFCFCFYLVDFGCMW